MPKFSPIVKISTSEATIAKIDEPKVTHWMAKKLMLVVSGTRRRRQAISISSGQTTSVLGRFQSMYVSTIRRVT